MLDKKLAIASRIKDNKKGTSWFEVPFLYFAESYSL